MKYILLLGVLLSCREKKDAPYRYSNVVIVGSDTITFIDCVTNYSRVKHKAAHGHNDTTNRVFYDTIWLPERPPIYIHDTIYRTKIKYVNSAWKDASQAHRDTMGIIPDKVDSLIERKNGRLISKWVDASQAMDYTDDTARSWVVSTKRATPAGFAKYNEYTIKSLSDDVYFEAPIGNWTDGNRLVVIIVFPAHTQRIIEWDKAYRASPDLAIPYHAASYKAIKMMFLCIDGKWNLLSYINYINYP